MNRPPSPDPPHSLSSLPANQASERPEPVTRDPDVRSRVPGREERRRQILDRAREVFAKKGYHAAKIEDIVVAAGVARGTFYLYFQDKKAIFEELVRGFFQSIALNVHRIDITAPIDAQVMDNVRRLVDVCLADPAMTKVLLADAMGLDVEFDQRLLAFYADIVELLENSLLEGQSLGIVQPGDVRIAAHFTLGGVKEVLLQFVRAPFPLDGSLASRAVPSLPTPSLDKESICRGIYAFLARGMLIESTGKGGYLNTTPHLPSDCCGGHNKP